MVAAKTEAHCVQQGWIEDMRLFNAGERSCILIDEMQIVERIRLREVCRVVKKCAGNAVTGRKMMINFRGIEVLVSNLAGGHLVVAHISGRVHASVRQRPEGEVW